MITVLEPIQDILIGQASQAFINKEYQNAEAFLLRAEKPEIAVDLYREAGRLADALRVAKEYAPTLVPEIQESDSGCFYFKTPLRTCTFRQVKESHEVIFDLFTFTFNSILGPQWGETFRGQRPVWNFIKKTKKNELKTFENSFQGKEIKHQFLRILVKNK